MNVPMHQDRRQFTESVRYALVERADDLFRQYIGAPVRTGSHDWRTKGRSSFSMDMRGEKRGLWNDHASGEGGDIFDFVAVHICGLTSARADFPRVVAKGAALVGLTQETKIDHAAIAARRAEREAQGRKAENAEAKQRAELTTRLIEKALPVQGSPAAAYLAGRGITELPSDGLAFLPPVPELAGPGMMHPKHPALVIWAKDDTLSRKGGQRILIDVDGRKVDLPDDTPRKPTFAAAQGNPARFPHRVEGGPLCVAEGPESALSIWQATGFETWAVFGVSNWASAPLPRDRKVILSPDRDAPVGTYPEGSEDAKRKESAARSFNAAVQHHLAAGVDLWIAEAPEPEGSKRDLNDTLMRAGNEAVSSAVAAAKKAITATSNTSTSEAQPASPVAKHKRQPVPPTFPAPEGDREAAIAAHRDTVAGFFGHAIPGVQAHKELKTFYAEVKEAGLPPEDRKREIMEARRRAKRDYDLDYLPSGKDHPPAERQFLTGAQGVGKTSAAITALYQSTGVVTLALLPDLSMTEEFAEKYRKGAPWGAPPVIEVRGRGAKDLAQPGRKMCYVPTAAAKLASDGVSPRQALCTTCPFADRCGWMKQEAELKAAALSPQGVVIAASHEYGTAAKLPGGIEPDLIFFDEAPRGLGQDVAHISFEELGKTLAYEPAGSAFGKVRSAERQADAEAGAMQSRWVRTKTRQAFEEEPDRAIGFLREEGVTVDMVQLVLAAMKDFQDRTAVTDLAQAWDVSDDNPETADEALIKIINKRDDKGVQRLERILKALLLDLETGLDEPTGLRFCENIYRGKNTERTAAGIEATYLKQLLYDDNISLLVADGTGDPDLAQAFFGPLTLAKHRVERKGSIRQVVGRNFSNRSITGKGLTGPSADEAAKLRDELVAYCHARPNYVVFACKTVKEALLSAGLRNDTGHFNAVRGRNAWEDVPGAIIIGRIEPSPEEVERIGRAYAAKCGTAFISLQQPDGRFGRWHTEQRGLRMRQGVAPPVVVNCHPDPWAERVLRQLRDAEITQTIDRLRLIFDGDHKEVCLLSPVVLDATIDHVETWLDAKKGGSRVSQAAEKSGVIPLNAGEAERLFPALWKHRRSAERDLEPLVALAESLGAHFPYNNSYMDFAHLSGSHLLEYLPEPKPGGRARYRHRAIVQAATVEEAVARLKELTGPLRDCVAVEGWQDHVAEALDAQEERAAIQAEGAAHANPPDAPEETDTDTGEGIAASPTSPVVWGEVCALPRRLDEERSDSAASVRFLPAGERQYRPKEAAS